MSGVGPVVVIAATPPVEKPTLGGNHRHLEGVLAVLAALGADVHLVSDEHPGYATFLDALPVRDRHAAPFCSDPATARAALDAILRRVRPRLVHVNGHQGWLEHALLDARELPAVPRKLFTMHLPVTSLDAAAATPKRFVPGSWAWTRRRCDARFLRSFDRVISVSARFGRALVDRGLLAADRVVVVPNGVDVDAFAPAARGDGGRCAIGGAGNLIPQKRFDLLIAAFAEVARRHDHVHLRVAGEGPEEASLRALADRLGVADRVELVGYQRDVARFLAELDVFVLSSSVEAAPYVALEAAACGTPSVLTDVGDVPHLFEDGADARIVPPGDAAALADAITALVASPDLRARMASAAREKVVAHYSQASWTRRMSELFSTELRRAGAGA